VTAGTTTNPPTAAEIAAAVAAPSTTAIVSAIVASAAFQAEVTAAVPTVAAIVAGVPSAAAIAAAVAAPSAATIAAAVAAPSLASITAGVPSTPRWVQLQNSAMGVTSVTFSGLSGYMKYRLIGNGMSAATSLTLRLRINGDSGTNYSYYGTTLNATPVWAPIGVLGGTEFLVAQSGGASSAGFNTDIDHASIASPKLITSRGQGQATINSSDVSGNYQTTSVISSITIFELSGHSIAGGTLYLLGAN
jgi:hypothetical protein